MSWGDRWGTSPRGRFWAGYDVRLRAAARVPGAQVLPWWKKVYFGTTWVTATCPGTQHPGPTLVGSVPPDRRSALVTRAKSTKAVIFWQISRLLCPTGLLMERPPLDPLPWQVLPDLSILTKL